MRLLITHIISRKNFAKLLLVTATFFSFSTLAQELVSTENTVDDTTKTFTLQIWAPDQIPPTDAKHVDIGEGYYYKYTPEIIEFNTSINRKINIEFANPLNDRYAFRWITSTSPGDVTLEEKNETLMRIAIDDGNDVASEMYIEVWVQDTQTGERFMCDPQIKNE